MRNQKLQAKRATRAASLLLEQPHIYVHCTLQLIFHSKIQTPNAVPDKNEYCIEPIR